MVMKTKEFDVRVIPAPVTSYAEETQANAVKYAFGIPTGNHNSGITINEAFSPVVCRDFLTDTLLAVYHKASISVYGFNFNPAQKSICLDNLWLCLSRKKVPLSRIHLQTILNDLHSTYVPKWEPFRVFTYDGGLVISGAKEWMSCSPIMSFLTLLIRLSTYEAANDITTVHDLIENFLANRNSYGSDGCFIGPSMIYEKAKKAFPKIPKILPKIEEVSRKVGCPVGLDWKENIRATHYSSGIYSMAGVISAEQKGEMSPYRKFIMKELKKYEEAA